jgi:SAM-dependent methyltransferase
VTLGADYFADTYAGSEDPWQLASRWYEQRKYALTMAALPVAHYRRGLEAGCSVGVLTRLLAERCDLLLAVDVAAAAVTTAARRNADQPQVTIEQRNLPRDWPAGSFDLVVISEIGYYFSPSDFGTLMKLAANALEPAGTLILVHWRHPVTDYPRSGDEVHQAVKTTAGQLNLEQTVAHKERDFLLDVYVRTPPQARSVAEQSGLA